jgi:hypothetical protein
MVVQIDDDEVQWHAVSELRCDSWVIPYLPWSLVMRDVRYLQAVRKLRHDSCCSGPRRAPQLLLPQALLCLPTCCWCHCNSRLACVKCRAIPQLSHMNMPRTASGLDVLACYTSLLHKHSLLHKATLACYTKVMMCSMCTQLLLAC